MGSKSQKSGFLVQGSILAIASILSRIIGLIYRIPMTYIIGDVGNNYYSTAYEVYNIMLLISCYSIPTAVSKLVSGYRAKGDMKTVDKIVKCALLISGTFGTLAFCVVFFAAPYITSLLQTPLSIYALMVLAPSLIIFSVMGVLRGLFQGIGSMVPTAFSQILEQIVNAIVSVAAAYILFQRGIKIGAVLGNAEEYSAAMGAAGGTLGSTLGAFASLLFVMGIFMLFRPKLKQLKKKQPFPARESSLSVSKLILITIVPVLLSTTIYNISGIIDQFIFKNLATIQEYSVSDIDVWWGVFSGKYKVIINVPLAIASSMAASAVPELAAAFASNDLKRARIKTHQAIRFVMVIAIPCVVGMGVLASPIMQLLFNDSSKLAANLLMYGSISIAFYSLSTLTNGILQGINRLMEPVKNAVVALVLHVIFLIVLMLVAQQHIYAVVYANCFYAFLMCILNAYSIRKYLMYRQEVFRTFIAPSVSAAIMGVSVYLTYNGGMKMWKFNPLWCILSIGVGIFIYFVFLLLLRGVSREELYRFPKGRLLVKFGDMLHLLRRE